MEDISLQDVLACLERSGYLLESRIVRSIESHGYFVEPNQVLRDPRTGKSREIDFVAESYDVGSGGYRTCVKTTFVGEIVNNRYPFVLMTRRQSTPNEDFENHIKYICTPDLETFAGLVDIYEERSPPRHLLYSQYCVLSRKNSGSKNELMASHPDDTYSSLQKLSEYVEAQLADWDEMTGLDQSFWRLFFWHPMLILGGKLIAVETTPHGSNELRPIESSFLEFNWHAGEERRTTVIEVVTAAALVSRMEAIRALDVAVQQKAARMRGGEVVRLPVREEGGFDDE